MKEMIKKITMAMLFFTLVLGMMSTNHVEAAKRPQLKTIKITLKVGQKKQLKVKNTKKKVKWSSSKKSVAKVSKKGKVTAKKAGKVTIYAKVGKRTLKCKVTVVKNKANSKKNNTKNNVSNNVNNNTSNTNSSTSKKILIAYFSATGSTKQVAEYIQKTASTEIYEITPMVPYTSTDLNWTEASSRVNKEHEDPSIEPEISGKINNVEQYDVIFLGYPIWWGEAPNILHTFLKSYDLSGKTIIPFCTSSSSGLGSSGINLQKFAPNATWQTGRRFSSYASQSEVESWAKSLNY